jgi:CheY-like chemotaxis protein
VIRVLIVDDHKVVRQGLRFLLEQEEGIEVAGECADGPSAIEAVRTRAPDVVLLDLFLPGLDGIGVLARIKQDRPATEVLMLTSSSDDEHLLAAIRLGDRAGPGDQRGDREGARLQDPRQAPTGRPHPGGDLRPATATRPPRRGAGPVATGRDRRVLPGVDAVSQPS